MIWFRRKLRTVAFDNICQSLRRLTAIPFQLSCKYPGFKWNRGTFVFGLCQQAKWHKYYFSFTGNVDWIKLISPSASWLWLRSFNLRSCLRCCLVFKYLHDGQLQFVAWENSNDSISQTRNWKLFNEDLPKNAQLNKWIGINFWEEAVSYRQAWL